MANGKAAQERWTARTSSLPQPNLRRARLRGGFLNSSKSPRLESFDKIVADVLAKVPDGSSPVFSLLPEIWCSPQVIAPEKVGLLVPHLREIKLYPQMGEFKFSTSGNYLHVSEGALNLVWCASYSSWFIYKAYEKAGNVVRFDNDADTVNALQLYEWAVTCVRERTHIPWPVGAPRPTRTPAPGSELLLANEVFLTAVAWMLLHEHGHLAHNHPFLASPRSVDEEHEADHFATDHVLGGTTDEAVRFKRGVGIVIANAVLLLVELMNGPAPPPTYPPIEERISRNLRGAELGTNVRIQAFATAMIQFHLRIVGICPVLEEHDMFGEFLDDFCLAINHWRKSG
jgi:hypothetical protein